jgi:hypothetical protein
MWTEIKPLLPKDLAGLLRRLDDAAIDALLSAVMAEAERRGRTPGGNRQPRRNQGDGEELSRSLPGD